MSSLFSICIPAYNRPKTIGPLLDSILSQDYDDYDVVICEDDSPLRAEVRSAVLEFAQQHPGRVKYYENETNLGYDGNLRNLVATASGAYCLFMGDDDLLCAGALGRIATAINRYPDVGVVLRSYASFNDSPECIDQVFRYFPQEAFFPAGPDTIVTFFRRSVVIPGMVVRRDKAADLATNRFDGTLLYQLYLVSSILTTANGVFLPEVLVLYRNGGVPFFGNSPAERGRFVPTQHTPESSLHFMRGMLRIARHVEESAGVLIREKIVRDIGNYSYPVLAIQADKELRVFGRYYMELGKMGLWKSPLFHIYFGAIVALGTERVDALIRSIKKRTGHTPNLGNVFGGKRP